MLDRFGMTQDKHAQATLNDYDRVAHRQRPSQEADDDVIRELKVMRFGA